MSHRAIPNKIKRFAHYKVYHKNLTLLTRPWVCVKFVGLENGSPSYGSGPLISWKMLMPWNLLQTLFWCNIKKKKWKPELQNSQKQLKIFVLRHETFSSFWFPLLRSLWGTLGCNVKWWKSNVQIQIYLTNLS